MKTISGCIQLFSRSVAASQCEAALAKRAKLSKGGWLSKWDQRILDAIEGLKAGALDVRALEAICESVKREKVAWMRKKGYCR